ncbi:hypothetical protein ACVIGB_001072 [Bradyrhizobium sp. USDA 4341]
MLNTLHSTPLNPRDLIAEKIWHAEYRRATGKPRLVDWAAGVSEEDKDRYRYVADAILSLAPDIGAARSETCQVLDPFFGRIAEISDRLTDRLRGRYAVGPTMPDGEPEFGWRVHEVAPIQKEAADAIDRLSAQLETVQNATIEACARRLKESYPEHAWLNAACAAIRSLSLAPEVDRGASPHEDDRRDEAGDAPALS